MSSAQFTEVSTQMGLSSQLNNSWGNPVCGDINNDGLLDLIVPIHYVAVGQTPYVYLNEGTSLANLGIISNITRNGRTDDGDWHGYALGDYDGDGNLDLYVAEGAKYFQGGTLKTDLLFKGVGDGTFTYVSSQAGMLYSSDRGRCGFWLDYDNDGKLDLFVKNYGSVNRLYRNNGNGTFTDVAVQAGLALATLGQDKGTICSFADYDNDGFMDVVFSGDGTTEALYHNQGDGTFIDVTATSGLSPALNAKGLAWGDYDNDGFLDLYVARGAFSNARVSSTLYRNNGNGTFTDVTNTSKTTVTMDAWAVVWGDYDNDGFLDLFICSANPFKSGMGNSNYLFRNNGDGTFTDVAATEGVQLEDNSSLHKGAAWVDFNNDGFLDLLTKDGIGTEKDVGTGAKGEHHLFQNSGNSNSWLRITLIGTQSNRNGIGARVTVTHDGSSCHRQNNGGGGGEYASQGSEPLYFGLGTSTTATVEVQWPSGGVDTLTDITLNQSIIIAEGESL